MEEPLRRHRAVTGRECGTCTWCCKVMNIKDLDKPAGQWCEHCDVGRGCRIYADRPPPCTRFACAWLDSTEWGPEWKPEKAKFVLEVNRQEKQVVVHLDPAMPDAWKRAPYQERIRGIMLANVPTGGRVFLQAGGHVTVLLPDGEHRLGPIRESDTIVVKGKAGPGFTRFEITVKSADGSIRTVD